LRVKILQSLIHYPKTDLEITKAFRLAIRGRFAGDSRAIRSISTTSIAMLA
jgi:hypothetical protein